MERSNFGEALVAALMGTIVGIFLFITMGWTHWWQVVSAGLVGAAVGFVSYKPKVVWTICKQGWRSAWKERSLPKLPARADLEMVAASVGKPVGVVLKVFPSVAERFCKAAGTAIIIAFNIFLWLGVPEMLLYDLRLVYGWSAALNGVYIVVFYVALVCFMLLDHTKISGVRGYKYLPQKTFALTRVVCNKLKIFEPVSDEDEKSIKGLKDLVLVSFLAAPILISFSLIGGLSFIADLVIFTFSRLATTKRLLVTVAAGLGTVAGCVSQMMSRDPNRAVVVGICVATVSLAVPWALLLLQEKLVVRSMEIT